MMLPRCVGQFIRRLDPHADELRHLQEQIDLLKKQLEINTLNNNTTMHIDHIDNYGVIMDVHHNTVNICPNPGRTNTHAASSSKDEHDTEETAPTSEEEPPAPPLLLTRQASPRGRRKTPIFTADTDVSRLAELVRKIHSTYYNPANRRIEMGEDCYNETDYLLALYYVMVKRGWASAELAAQPYYDFLTDVCGIRPQDTNKTFLRHLNKVVRTGKSFHKLTPEMLAAEKRPGTLTARELPAWQRMFSAAEKALLESDI